MNHYNNLTNDIIKCNDFCKKHYNPKTTKPNDKKALYEIITFYYFLKQPGTKEADDCKHLTDQTEPKDDLGDFINNDTLYQIKNLICKEALQDKISWKKSNKNSPKFTPIKSIDDIGKPGTSQTVILKNEEYKITKEIVQNIITKNSSKYKEKKQGKTLILLLGYFPSLTHYDGTNGFDGGTIEYVLENDVLSHKYDLLECFDEMHFVEIPRYHV